MKLTPTQVQHLNSVNWLVDSHVGQGKTTLILYCLFLKAIRNPHKNIYIIDHLPMTEMFWQSHMMRLIRIMMQDIEFNDYHIKVNISNKSICYIP